MKFFAKPLVKTAQNLRAFGQKSILDLIILNKIIILSEYRKLTKFINGELYETNNNLLKFSSLRELNSQFFRFCPVSSSFVHTRGFRQDG